VKQVRWSPAADGIGTLRLGNRAFKMARISGPNWAGGQSLVLNRRGQLFLFSKRNYMFY
jgi:hypothetical protein